MFCGTAYAAEETAAKMAQLDLPGRDPSHKLPEEPSTATKPTVSIKGVGKATSTAAAAVQKEVKLAAIKKHGNVAAAAALGKGNSAKQGGAGVRDIKKVKAAATAAAIQPVLWTDVEFSGTSPSEEERWSTHADGSTFGDSVDDSDDIARSTPDYSEVNDKTLGYYVELRKDESTESEKLTLFKFNEDELSVIRENSEQIRTNMENWAKLFHAFYITRGYDEVRVELERTLDRIEVEAMEKDASVLSWRDLFAKKSGYVRGCGQAPLERNAN